MRSISTASVITGALAFVLASSVTLQRAEAGPACNRIGLNSPCIKSNDLKARINLRESGRDGRLQIRGADNRIAVNLDGSSGNATNLFSNDENASNGLVKAWARINEDGTVFACWRCNKDTAETRRVSDGFYEVDFTPLATDISGRPMTGVVEGGLGSLVVNNNNADLSTVFVSTFFPGVTDRSFILVIY